MGLSDRRRSKVARDGGLWRNEDAKERHAKLCGELVWEWNQLHRIFSFVFTTLLGDGNLALAPALWNAIASDTAQRDLLRTAVEWADEVRQKDRDRLIWALDQTQKLAPYRNDIVHGAGGFLLSLDGVTTTFSVSGNPLKRLMRHARADTPLPELMAAIGQDIKRLSEFVLTVWRRIGMDEADLKPSPRRPKLRSLLLVQAGSFRTNIQPRRKAPKRPRPKPRTKPSVA